MQDINYENSHSPLVSCQWLNLNLNQKHLIILDATFFLPRQKRNRVEEYKQEHIPSAFFFDIDNIADRSNPLPHMLPDADNFAIMVGNLGINNDTTVIVYDNNALFAAARAWWMFRIFGHDKVFVLDGGLKCWKSLGLPLQSNIPLPQPKRFISRFRRNLVCNLEQMKRIHQQSDHLILDSRSPDSFRGERPVTDPNIKTGHIPGSINVPYSELRSTETNLMHSPETLESLFKPLTGETRRSIVATCGSGVSAAILALALFRIGLTGVSVYDGSWAEWGRQKETPAV